VEDNQTPLTSALLAVASVFIIIFGIKLSAPIVTPIVLAMVITISVLPLPDRLARRGLHPLLSLGLTVLVVVGLLVLVIVVILGALSQFIVQIPSYLSDIAARTPQLADWLGNFQRPTAFEGIDSSLIVQAGGAVAGASVSLLISTALTLLIVFYMVAAATSFSRRSDGTAPTSHPALSRIADLTVEVRRYVTITTTVNMLVGLGDALLLWVLGVDFALLWGILSWILGYIPSVGFWLALIPPLILGLAESGYQTAIFVLLGYWLINGSVENLLKPRLMGESLRISPVIVIVSLFVWGWLLGAIGALLAIPLTLLVLKFLEGFESTRWLIILLRPTTDVEEDEKGKAQRRLTQVWERVKGATQGHSPTDTT
jgi:predicted PurR-regulated permease PerM